MLETWLIGTDNTILIPGLHQFDEERTNPTKIVYLIAGVTVAGSFKDSAGTVVSTIDTISYLAGTKGDWVVILAAADMSLTENSQYTADFTVSAGGRSRQYKITRRAVYGN